jgi:CubicO group peptidase (beta-lactamase class C family)
VKAGGRIGDDGGMTDLGHLAQQTADRLAGQRVGVVVPRWRAEARRSAAPAGSRRHVFEIGSVTKVFTAQAWRDWRWRAWWTWTSRSPRSCRRVPGYRRAAARRSRCGTSPPTRSGLPRLPTGMLLPALLHPGTPDPYADCTADRLLRALAATRLGAVPGRRFRYSNFGAGLLGLALAHRAGVGYPALIDREICGPLGLTDTGVDIQPDRLAQGHTARRKPTPAWHLADLAGAGGLRSTSRRPGHLRPAPSWPARPPRSGWAARSSIGSTRSPGCISAGWAGACIPGRAVSCSSGTAAERADSASFVGFDPERQVAVVALSNTQRPLDKPAFELLGSLPAGR